MKRNLLIIIALLLTVGIFTSTAAAQNYSFSRIDVPGARATQAWGINAGGDIVGTFVDADFVQHGFLLQGGNFTTIDFPGADGTDARGIGPGGEIVGNYWNDDEPLVASHGYRLSRKGVFSELSFPGHLYTIAQRFLPDGTVLGCRHNENTTNTMRGVLISRFETSEIDKYASMNNGATPDLSRIVGLYTNTELSRTEGYTIDNGIFTPFIVPGSTFTAAWDVNPDGQVVGVFRNAAGFHGFVRTGDEFETLDFPSAVATRAFGINARGDVVGSFFAGGATSGFVARLIDE